MTIRLFPSVRTCEICGDSEPVGNRWHKPIRKASVVALNVSIYRKVGTDRGQVASALGVRVCEKCLVLASRPGKESEQLGMLLVAATLSRYGVMAEEMPG